MKKAILIMFFGILTLSTGCSKDDMAGHESNAEVSEMNTKGRVMCTDMELLKMGCTSSSGNVNSAVTFTWNNTDLSYVFNRVYKSYIQIESNGCSGNNTSPVSIPVHLFTTSSYTHAKGHNETCFRYRIVVLGYDRGQMACESISPWQVFSYTK
jgi:hypothetical protein